MLISPPFLPARQANESEDAWLDRCMQGGQPGDGAFPLSMNLGWHGGMHLIAPQTNGQPEAVRAIADGTVVLVRTPKPQPAGTLSESEPLAYRGGWTDNGVVVLKHDTEIGEGADAKVVFFSIYMHLSAIDSAVAQGRTVYRKAALGMAGQIYGALERRIHFEIVCDDANLKRLVGRSSGDLDTSKDGRTDAVYGQIYFFLPSGTQFFEERPLDHMAQAHVQPPKPDKKSPLPAPRPLQPVHTSVDPLVVALRFAGGEGTAGHRGSAYLESLRLDGTNIADPLEEVDAEYDIYKRANEISKAYPSGGRPAPSAVYELLRFGRVINTEHETLTPSDVPHWRKVCFLGGQGWVNLNGAGVRKYSDADFPHWRRWSLIDDSADQDSRCDSKTLKSWLDISGDGQVDPIEAAARLSDASVAPKLAHAICKFPTEWDASTIEQRWGWLKTQTDENPSPFTETDFALLKAHIQALAFFPGGMGVGASHWHWQPKKFVGILRRCRWIDDSLLERIYPQASSQNRRKYGLEIARCVGRYLIFGSVRQGNFFGQAAVESAQLRFMSELYNGDPFAYFRSYAKAKNFAGWLGNVEWNDGGSFRGRGFKQMTGRDNYSKYWVYRGWLSEGSFDDLWWRNPRWWGLSGANVPSSAYGTLPIQDPAVVQNLIGEMRPPIIDNPDIVSSDINACIDTAGWFWAKNRLLETADSNDVAEMTRKIRGDGAAVGASQPWPAAAHFPERRENTQRIEQLLGDVP